MRPLRWGDALPDGEADGAVPWPSPTGPLRPCVEDELGAGAIVAALSDEHPARSSSSEAMAAALAFRAAEAQVDALVAGSVSGRDLREHGRRGDVEQAVAVDVSAVVPLLTNGTFDDAARRARG